MSISPDTLNTAMEWYETGIARVSSGQYNLGLSYLDRAIAVFGETRDMRHLTLARHHKLLAYLQDDRPEEAESLFEDLMVGYTGLNDAYGQALALTHLAQCQESQDNSSEALTNLHLARVIAESHQLASIQVYVVQQMGALYRKRDNHVQALRLFELGEQIAGRDNLERLFSHLRFQRAETLVALGESGAAFALLEDVQTRLMNAQDYQEALRPLSLLRQIYENREMHEDLDRVITLVHHCGQNLMQSNPGHQERRYSGPQIGRGA